MNDGILLVSKLSIAQLLQLWHYLHNRRGGYFSIRSLKCLFSDGKLNVSFKKRKCSPGGKKLMTRHVNKSLQFQCDKSCNRDRDRIQRGQ